MSSWYENLPPEDVALARGTPAGLAVIHTQFFAEDSGQQWKLYPYMRLIAERTQPILTKGGRLHIAMPPRHGKSLFCSVFVPAWFVMFHRTKNVILTGYSTDLSRGFSIKARTVVECMGHLFGVRVNPRQMNAEHWQVQYVDETGEWRDGGNVYAAGAKGTLTGRGASLIVIDDPTKGGDDAKNPETMRKLYEDWFESVIDTRLEPLAPAKAGRPRVPGAMLLPMTRWAMADLAGRIFADHADEWDELVLPALAKEDDPLGRAPGEALCEERFSREWLEKKRDSASEGGLVFSALYQQEPMPEDGAVFKVSLIGKWRYQGDAIVYGNRTISTDDLAVLFATIDPALKDKEINDPTGFIVWAITMWGDLLAMEDHTKRMRGSDDLLPAMRSVRGTHPSIVFYVEDQAHGTEIMRACMRERLPVLPLTADRDKVTRAIGAQPAFAARRVFLPEEGAEPHVRELLEFPGGRYDDRVDCTSYAVQVYHELVAHLNEAGYARDLADALAAKSTTEDPTDADYDPAEIGRDAGGLWRP